MSAAENLDRSSRLPWIKREDGKGFLAQPDGPDHPERYAEIWHVPQPYAEGLHWGWIVHWGRAKRAGQSQTAQDASDYCNRHWVEVEAEGIRLAEANRDVDQLMGRVDEIARSGFADVESFALSEMEGPILLQLVRHCREHWERAFRDGKPLAGVEMLMGAASAELHKRRLEGRPVERSDGSFGQFQPPKT